MSINIYNITLSLFCYYLILVTAEQGMYHTFLRHPVVCARRMVGSKGFSQKGLGLKESLCEVQELDDANC